MKGRVFVAHQLGFEPALRRRPPRKRKRKCDVCPQGQTRRKKRAKERAFWVARQLGFEPKTYGLEVRCSIQLGYWRKWSG